MLRDLAVVHPCQRVFTERRLGIAFQRFLVAFAPWRDLTLGRGPMPAQKTHRPVVAPIDGQAAPRFTEDTGIAQRDVGPGADELTRSRGVVPVELELHAELPLQSGKGDLLPRFEQFPRPAEGHSVESGPVPMAQVADALQDAEPLEARQGRDASVFVGEMAAAARDPALERPPELCRCLDFRPRIIGDRDTRSLLQQAAFFADQGMGRRQELECFVARRVVAFIRSPFPVLLLPCEGTVTLPKRNPVASGVPSTMLQEFADRPAVVFFECLAVGGFSPLGEARSFVRTGAPDRLQVTAPLQGVLQCAAQVVRVGGKRGIEQLDPEHVRLDADMPFAFSFLRQQPGIPQGPVHMQAPLLAGVQHAAPGPGFRADLRVRLLPASLVRSPGVELVDSHRHESREIGKLGPPARLRQCPVVGGDVLRRQEVKARAVLEQDAPADVAVADVEADAIAGERPEVGFARRTTAPADSFVHGIPLLRILIIVGQEGDPCERFHVGVLPLSRQERGW